MTALSRSSILARMRSRELVISPILGADQLGMSSVDLRMGTVVLVARAGAQSHVDPDAYANDPQRAHGAMEGKKQKHERFDIPFGESFLLHPGALALVPTLEWVVLPGDIQGVVTARSSWAREGLNIATATIVNPGYMGIVTLELANFGQIPIKLYPGLRLAQIAFYGLNRMDPARDDEHLKMQGQFHMAFEPSAGDIAKKDEAFLRRDSVRT
ncbi:dCTP deaminase [Hydrogenophaga intermedia]|uniref:Deoxycytidine triphosphate deaminase n=1 Tax=Hydrogenophaga intermedia TaxID=65786 RepID=A0A1L1PE88_HYDIT|nr:dCTP deaminase [Hydrogenophaga intermedia]TMU72086.1 dCTP deaminase [Hydrogenophaga intermedia]CDN88382.1 Deoxycytidine triphosphate deaminase [Hydrogenophaga intermedia]